VEDRWKKNPLQDVRGFEPTTYTDLDITYRDAHVWQTLANMPEPLFENFITDKRDAIEEITRHP
jgi:hypothetical protein